MRLRRKEDHARHGLQFERGLTPREMQILDLTARGRSAKEAAAELGIAPRTVERHVDNVRLKLQARNRSHMIGLALSIGLLAVDDSGVHSKDSPELPLDFHHLL